MGIGVDEPAGAAAEAAADGLVRFPWFDIARQRDRLGTLIRHAAINAASFGHILAHQRRQPVGQKKPNGFGLYDMLGNVLEWNADWYGSYEASKSSDPQGPQTGTYRLLRGGGWYVSPSFVRASDRGGLVPGGRYNSVGFRCHWE